MTVSQYSNVNAKPQKKSDYRIPDLMQRNRNYDLVNIVDLTKRDKPHSVKKVYDKFSVFIACHAFTNMAAKPQTKLVSGIKSLGDLPTTISIITNINEETTIFQNGLITFDEGMVLGFCDPESSTYLVELASSSEEKLNELNRMWEETIESSNFYRGKCLHFRKNNIVFMPTPDTTFDSVVFSPSKLENFTNNTIKFLQSKNNIKRRSVILYGPPGTGKTTLVSSAMHEAHKMGVSSIMVTGEAFDGRFTPEHLMDFTIRFLCPALIVFEDIDLLTSDRAIRPGPSSASTLIGDMLSILDGVDKRGDGLVIIATTNRLDAIDEAVVRPCRFDRRIEVGYPTLSELQTMWNKMGGRGTIPDKILEHEKVTGAHIYEVIKSCILFPSTPIQQVVDEVMDSFFVSAGKVGFQSRRNGGEGVTPHSPPVYNPHKTLIGPGAV